MGHPSPELLFDSPSVQLMLSQLLAEYLTGHEYRAKRSADTVMGIVNAARDRIKAIALPR